MPRYEAEIATLLERMKTVNAYLNKFSLPFIKQDSDLKYGNSSTYKFNLNKAALERLSESYNRSQGQILFLLQLVKGDFFALAKLLDKLKSKHFMGCPSTMEEVINILV